VRELPTGTVTFLFTDLEGSTRLWEEHPDEMRDALARHDGVLRQAVAAEGGRVVKGTGDGLHAVFGTAEAAVSAAVAGQLALSSEGWGATGPLRARMGLHTGSAERRGGDYFGPVLNRAARLMAVAHPGQVLCSQATADLVRDSLAPSLALRDLGEHRLRDLSRPERVFQIQAPGLQAEFGPLASLDAFPSNLPVALTSFVGRWREFGEVCEALDAARVVTLTGVGGVGKTRLALQVAAELLPRFRDGVWLVELAAAVEAGALVEVIATTLDVPERPSQSRSASLADFLRAKRLLLVLDNCEHLLDAVAGYVEEVVSASPNVVVLATSREGLGVSGERIFVVRSLDVPAEDTEPGTQSAEAVRLFVERAADAKAGFVLSDANAPDVARLVRRLDGIPLAIELAAARVRSLTPGELADRLDERFRLLAGGRRTAVERHQTLQRAIDWSYDLLSPTEQRALDRLAVFIGDFSLVAAESVIADEAIDALEVMDLLGRLVDKSLVLAEDTDGVTRYRLLETIRQYAQARLEASGDAEAFRHKHACHFATVAAEAGRGMRTRDEAAWTDRAERELDNIRAAFVWSVDNDQPDLALGIVTALALNGTRIGYAIGSWGYHALGMPSASTDRLYPQVLAWAGWDQAIAGDVEGAGATCQEALDAAAALDVDAAARCRVLACAAGVAGWANRTDDVAAVTEEWVALARQIGDDYELAQALGLAGLPPSENNDPAQVMARTDEALAVARRLGNPTTICYAAQCAAGFTFESRPQTAMELFAVALQAAESVGNQLGIGVTLNVQAWRHTTMGNWTEAAPLVLRSVQHFHRAGDHTALGQAHACAVGVLNASGGHETAAVLFGTTSVANQITLHGHVAEFFAMVEAELREHLGDEHFAECVARGHALDEDQAFELARRELTKLTTGRASQPSSTSPGDPSRLSAGRT
jgi:predicted ATPase/class 3 adenylate cyclase